ncbi:MAG: hypothetical protein K8S55_00805 [Phycisphaerae bacterium]|nr:hypothetical protein [Phycisphaerae bacterium]
MKQIIITCLLCVLTAGLFAAEPANTTKAPDGKNPVNAKFKSRKIRLGRVEYTSQIKLTEKKYRREMEKLQKQQAEALKATREKFVKLLEAEKRAVMKAGDLPEAIKIDNAINVLKNPIVVSTAGEPEAAGKKNQNADGKPNAATIKKLDGYARVLADCIVQANDLKQKHSADGGGAEWKLTTKNLLLGEYNRMFATLRKIHAKTKKSKTLQQKYAPTLKTFANQLYKHGKSFLGLYWMTPSDDPEKIQADIRKLRKKISEVATGKGGAGKIKMKCKLPR